MDGHDVKYSVKYKFLWILIHLKIVTHDEFWDDPLNDWMKK